MYKCNNCGKQFEEPIVKEDLEESIAVCPFCDSEWIKEMVIVIENCEIIKKIVGS